MFSKQSANAIVLLQAVFLLHAQSALQSSYALAMLRTTVATMTIAPEQHPGEPDVEGSSLYSV